MIDIRKAGDDSAAELSDLCATSFADAYRGVNSDADIKAYCEKNYARPVIEANLANPDVLYMVAYRNDKAVGFFMIQHQACPIALAGNPVELKQIYVLASEFGSGLGKLLLEAVIRRARQQGKNRVWLSVSDLNTRAKSFYAKHGFEPVGAAPVLQVGNDRLPATVMVLDL